MSCPFCGCKETYAYDAGEEDFCTTPDGMLERCSACRAVFDIEDHAPEDDDAPITPSAETHPNA